MNRCSLLKWERLFESPQTMSQNIMSTAFATPSSSLRITALLRYFLASFDAISLKRCASVSEMVVPEEWAAKFRKASRLSKLSTSSSERRPAFCISRMSRLWTNWRAAPGRGSALSANNRKALSKACQATITVPVGFARRATGSDTEGSSTGRVISRSIGGVAGPGSSSCGSFAAWGLFSVSATGLSAIASATASTLSSWRLNSASTPKALIFERKGISLTSSSLNKRKTKYVTNGQATADMSSDMNFNSSESSRSQNAAAKICLLYTSELPTN